MPEYFSQLHDIVEDYHGNFITLENGEKLRYVDIIFSLVSSMRASSTDDALEADYLCRTFCDPNFESEFDPSLSEHYRGIILQAIDQNACGLSPLFISVAARLVSD